MKQETEFDHDYPPHTKHGEVIMWILIVITAVSLFIAVYLQRTNKPKMISNGGDSVWHIDR